jgi:hypothetical protein
LGSKAGSGGASGAIDLYDEQKALTSLDLPRLRTTVQRIRHLIGYDTYDVTLLLVDDKAMTATNLESRSIDAPTDILSFPFHGAISPGTLEDVPFDIPDYYMLVSTSFAGLYCVAVLPCRCFNGHGAVFLVPC